MNFRISVFSRSLNLSWSPPLHSQQNGIIISYTVTCSSQSHNVNKRINFNFVLITDLVPGNNYTCSVYGSTIVGNGPPEVKSVVTKEESEFLSCLIAIMYEHVIIICIQDRNHLLLHFMQV